MASVPTATTPPSMTPRESINRLRFGLLILAMIAPPTSAENRSLGIVGQLAPAWQVDRWFNLPEGADSLDVSDLHGKVVYLFCFQSWCPGCHSHGFPALQQVSEHFAARVRSHPDCVRRLPCQHRRRRRQNHGPLRSRHSLRAGRRQPLDHARLHAQLPHRRHAVDDAD